MLIALGGLVAAVAASATITVSILASDGGGAPADESVGTQEPAVDTGGPNTIEPGPGQADGKGGEFVTNPDGDDGATDGPVLDPVDGVTGGPVTGGHDAGIPKPPDWEPLTEDSPRREPLGDDEAGEVVGEPTTYETWLKDNPPTDDMSDTGTETDVPVIEPLSPSPTDDVEGSDDQVIRATGGLAVLEVSLLAIGAEVKVTGEEVNGESVQVMDYGDAAALEVEATGISPDGSSVGITMIMWVAAPHFFRTDSLMVLYVGESPTVTEALTQRGPQFAGR